MSILKLEILCRKRITNRLEMMRLYQARQNYINMCPEQVKNRELMITQSFKIKIAMIVMLICVSSTNIAAAEFVPWDPLIYDVAYGPSWLVTHPEPAFMYAVNGGQYKLGFGIARTDGGARGMNALTFASGSQNTGHVVSSSLTGSFNVHNSGRHTFNDVLLLTTIGADSLPADFSFSVVNDCNTFDCNDVYCFDNVNDFTFYDPNQLNYATDRPSGFYWATSPDSESVSYLSDTGMVTIFSFKNANLGANQSITINYAFENLRTDAVFSVYGYDELEGYIYHTNRAQPDGNDPTAVVSTFAVIPQPPEADLNGDWSVNMVDFSYFSSCWMRPKGSDPNDICYRCDFSGDSFISVEDLLFFADQYLNGSAN